MFLKSILFYNVLIVPQMLRQHIWNSLYFGRLWISSKHWLKSILDWRSEEPVLQSSWAVHQRLTNTRWYHKSCPRAGMRACHDHVHVLLTSRAGGGPTAVCADAADRTCRSRSHEWSCASPCPSLPRSPAAWRSCDWSFWSCPVPLKVHESCQRETQEM